MVKKYLELKSMSENPKSSEEQTEKKVPSTKKRFSVKEAEALGYYDFMSYLGVSYYHIGGLTSSKKLAELCQIDSTKKNTDGRLWNRFFCLLPRQKNRL